MDTTNWPRRNTTLRTPDHFKRVECKTQQAFFLEFLASKRARHSTFTLTDIYAHSIGFVDYAAEKWVLIELHRIRESSDERPEDSTEEQWNIFRTYLKTEAGRVKLFGEPPSPSVVRPDCLDEPAGEPKVEVLEVVADPRGDEEAVGVR